MHARFNEARQILQNIHPSGHLNMRGVTFTTFLQQIIGGYLL